MYSANEINLDAYQPNVRIVVIGVGGGGSNAVNRMIDEEIENVEFYVVNTDKQALAASKADNKIVLGNAVTSGRGAGGDPKVGEQAALESEEQIRQIVQGANLVFISAGMGGGTGTGASPVIAKIAKEEGALTVAVVTRPFLFEGKNRIATSVAGLNALKNASDAIMIVSNDKLLMTSGNLKANTAFSEADKVLAQAVKTVVELILNPATINSDFNDVVRVLKGSGIALIGYGEGHGEHKAVEAAENAISNPLLEITIAGATKALCCITCGDEVNLVETQECVNRITEAAGTEVDVKFGFATNNQLGDGILVSIIASGYSSEYDFTAVPEQTSKTSFSSVGNGIDEAKQSHVEAAEEQIRENGQGDLADNADSILPDFLRNGI